MQPQRIVRATSFAPDALAVIFAAFDGAWTEIAPAIGGDPAAVESARASLAGIVLGLASADTIAPDGLRTMAVAVFCAKHRIAPERVYAASRRRQHAPLLTSPHGRG